jgi:hypothetical protein
MGTNERSARLCVGASAIWLSLFISSAALQPTRAATPAMGHATNDPPANDASSPDQVQTLTGTIVNMNGTRLILRDDDHDTWYHLDDQNQAGKFLGKKVIVRGHLDTRTDMIHVQAITEEPKGR